jgi:hypothetical protein
MNQKQRTKWVILDWIINTISERTKNISHLKEFSGNLIQMLNNVQNEVWLHDKKFSSLELNPIYFQMRSDPQTQGLICVFYLIEERPD